MMALAFLLLSYINIPVSAHPLQSPVPLPSPLNKTALSRSKVGWTSTPQVRGTADLLISCLTTLFLCAWTAYHPNVHRRRSEWHNFGHRIIWMSIAVLVPEVVLFCAWEQWGEARRLRASVNKYGEGALGEIGVADEEEDEECDVCRFKDSGEDGGDGIDTPSREEDAEVEEDISPTTTELDPEFIPLPNSPEPSIASTQAKGSLQTHFLNLRAKMSRKQKSTKSVAPETWSMEQAHFALSGGFAISSSAFSPHSTLTFTPSGVKFLAKLGLLPRISHDSVVDKSKADWIAKVLVCVQASWFFVQCIARVSQKLPLTLLELHVLTHVVCAFGMYVLWWGKPYDVGTPVLCEDEVVVDLGALWSLHVKNEHKYTHDKRINCCVTDSSITPAQIISAHTHPNSLPSTSHHKYATLIKSYFDLSSRATPAPSSLSPSLLQPNTSPSFAPKATLHLERATRALSYLSNHSIHQTYLSNPTTYITKACPSSTSPSMEQDYTSIPATSLTFPSPLIVPFRSNLRITGTAHIFSNTSFQNTTSPRLLDTAALLSVVYGSAHLAVWNFEFASEVEMWFWRASGVVMVGMPVGVWCAVRGLMGSAWLGEYARKGRRKGGVGQESIEKVSSSPVKGRTGTADASQSAESCSNRARQTLSPTIRFGLRALARLLELFLSFVVLFPASLLAAFGMALYPVARVYVLAESFAALRASDPDVYNTVEWANYIIPHAG